MATFTMFTFVFLIFSTFCITIFGDEDLYSLVVEHSLEVGGQTGFVRRGVIDVHSLKSNVAEYTSETLLTEDDKNRLKELVDQDEIYRVRVGKWASDDSRITYVYSCIKACALYESRLADVLTIHVDQSGALIAASLTAPVSYCSGVTLSHRDLPSVFNTTVIVQQTTNGPAKVMCIETPSNRLPETQAYIQKIEHERMEKAKGQQADNRSFFAKYWMYLVPLVIFMMVLSNQDQNQGGGGGR